MCILLAVGTGYIGSHTAIQLIEAGHDVIISDSYCNSSNEAIRRIEKLRVFWSCPRFSWGNSKYSQTYKKGDEAYYPVNNARNNEMYAKYAEEAAKTPNLILGGRLGAYRYWDMDKAIADALNVFETKILPAGVCS